MKELAPGTIYIGACGAKWVILPNGNAIGLGSNGTYEGIPPEKWTGCKPKKVIGRLPPSELDATKWDYKYELPEAYDPKAHYLYWGTNDIQVWTYSSPEWYTRNTDSLEKYVVERPSPIPQACWATWRGWDCFDKPMHAVKSGKKLEAFTRPELLDRIAEAEGLRLPSQNGEKRLSGTQKWRLKIQAEWCDKLQDFDQRHATGGAGQDVCDVAIRTALDWKEQLATERAAREKAEKKAATLREDRNKLFDAFRAATGHDYEPGRDYSMPKLKPGDRFRFLTMPEYWGDRDRGSDIVWRVKTCGTKGEREDGLNTAECSIEPRMDIEILDSEKETPMSARDLPVGAVFRHPEAKKHKRVWWVNDGNGKCHKQDDPSYITNISDSPYVTKGAFMSKSKVFGKYAALFVLFSALSNPTDIWQSAKDWWTAPTKLELGDWTRVTRCKDCSAVVPKVDVGGAGATIPPSICTKCGGEEFERRKAQELTRPATLKNGPLPFIMDNIHAGYRFEDGTTTVVPVNWTVPEVK